MWSGGEFGLVVCLLLLGVGEIGGVGEVGGGGGGGVWLLLLLLCICKQHTRAGQNIQPLAKCSTQELVEIYHL